MNSTDFNFPVAGLDRSDAFGRQKPRKVAEGVYARTTIDAQNVQGYDVAADRKRGGTRPGLAKVFPQAVVPGWIVQGLGFLVGPVFNRRLADGSLADPNDEGVYFHLGPWESISKVWDEALASWENA